MKNVTLQCIDEQTGQIIGDAFPFTKAECVSFKDGETLEQKITNGIGFDGDYLHLTNKPFEIDGTTLYTKGNTTGDSTYSFASGKNTKINVDNSHTEGAATFAGNYTLVEKVAITSKTANSITVKAKNEIQTSDFIFLSNGSSTQLNVTNVTVSNGSTTIEFDNITLDLTQSLTHISVIREVTVATETNPYTNPASHAEGVLTIAQGKYSHAEGNESIASGMASHAEGYTTVASGQYSHAEGHGSKAEGFSSHVEGQGTKATENCGHAEGYGTLSSSMSAHAEGYETKAIGMAAHAEGNTTTATEMGAHAEGYNTNAVQMAAHAEGQQCTASGMASHAEGMQTNAAAMASHAEGQDTVASAPNSHASGLGTLASQSAQFVAGKYNAQDVTGSSLFIIGNGVSPMTRSNALAVHNLGNIVAQGAYSNNGSNYAEMFEWTDGNLSAEDRMGYFVTFEQGTNKIRKANDTDTYILGIITADSTVIGNNYDAGWNEPYVKDSFGRIVYSAAVAIADEEVESIAEPKAIKTPQINSSYNASKVFIPRNEQDKWGQVGIMGKIWIHHDGTCNVGDFCKSNADGIATKADTGYYVLEKNDVAIRVMFK